MTASDIQAQIEQLQAQRDDIKAQIAAEKEAKRKAESQLQQYGAAMTAVQRAELLAELGKLNNKIKAARAQIDKIDRKLAVQQQLLAQAKQYEAAAVKAEQAAADELAAALAEEQHAAALAEEQNPDRQMEHRRALRAAQRIRQAKRAAAATAAAAAATLAADAVDLAEEADAIEEGTDTPPAAASRGPSTGALYGLGVALLLGLWSLRR